jgi:hypothetical protein
MNKTVSLIAAVATFVSSPLSHRSAAVTESEAAAGRALIDRQAAVVVNLEIVASIKLPSRDRDVPPREQKIEINGTVISPSGLTAIPLSAADPRPLVASVGPSGPTSQSSPDATIKSIKLIFSDGSELPGEIVAKDADTGLAFVAPIETNDAATRTLDFLELEDAAEGGLLQNCIFIGRTPPAHHSLPLVRVSYIMGIFEKPTRSYILPEQHTGVPAFTVDGKVLGIATAYLVNHRPVAAVIVPASEVARAVQRSIPLVR